MMGIYGIIFQDTEKWLNKLKESKLIGEPR